ncbi:hypothetical protein PG994_009653 [Apiospora phragmitis]|uniref:Uncharacterized protein n=1 Tax=Apiospora phragmitis TaxID=2905665 RepID=A0ABR1U6Q6_9PEZI
MLASRVVHFTATELVWECNTHCRCECAELEGQAPENQFGEGHSLKSHFVSMLQGRKVWEAVFQNYSVKQLTVASDLLPALAGLAQRLASPAMGKYLADVWSSQLPDALVWCTFAAERTERYRAPSWSWASREGEVRCTGETIDYQYGKSCLEIIAAECTPAGKDPYGAVSGGDIVVKGEFRPHSDPQHDGPLEMGAFRVRESHFRYNREIAKGRRGLGNRQFGQLPWQGNFDEKKASTIKIV